MSLRLTKIVPMSTGTSFQHRRIAAARADAGLTQAQLADAVSVSRTAVQKWERGDAAPNSSTLARIATATGWPIERFFTGPETTSRDAHPFTSSAAADLIGA